MSTTTTPDERQRIRARICELSDALDQNLVQQQELREEETRMLHERHELLALEATTPQD